MSNGKVTTFNRGVQTMLDLSKGVSLPARGGSAVVKRLEYHPINVQRVPLKFSARALADGSIGFLILGSSDFVYWSAFINGNDANLTHIQFNGRNLRGPAYTGTFSVSTRDEFNSLIKEHILQDPSLLEGDAFLLGMLYEFVIVDKKQNLGWFSFNR